MQSETKMKTSLHNQKRDELVIEDYSWLIKIALVIFLVILNICIANSQNSHMVNTGGGIELSSSGNGLGAFTVPHLNLGAGRNTFMAGIMIQNQSGSMKGVKISYSRNLSGVDPSRYNEDYVKHEPEPFQLNFLSYFQYNSPALLCSHLAQREQVIHRESTVNYSQLMLSSIESGVGIEFRVNITSNICLRSFISSGVYYHPNYSTPLDHEKCATTLQLGTGLNFKI